MSYSWRIQCSQQVTSSSCMLEMEESVLDSLRETVRQQNMIMQKLYTELEEEREASATAASEALSMILRLQGEKAIEKMEACQYKRMAEEKMRHAEESLVIFEDLLYQKEMEIASLKLVVEDYMEKFGDMSPESDCSQTKIFANSKCGNSSLPEKSSNRIIAKRSSLPVLQIKELCSQIDNIERDVLSCRTAYSMQRKSNTHECIGTGGLSRRTSVSPDKYLAETPVCHSKQEEEVKEKFLDLHAQEKILASSHMGNDVEECSNSTSNGFVMGNVDVLHENGASTFSGKHARINDKIYSSIAQKLDLKVDIGSTSYSPPKDPDFLVQHDDSDISYVGSPSKADALSSVNTYDIHEIPQSEKSMFEMQKLSFDDKSKFKPTIPVTKEVLGYLGNDAPLQAVMGSRHVTTMLLQKKNTNATNNAANDVDVSSTSVQLIERRLQIIEENRKNTLLQNAQREQEQLKLLREIHDQLTRMRSCINEEHSEKAAVKERQKYDLFIEAMLSFSI